MTRILSRRNSSWERFLQPTVLILGLVGVRQGLTMQPGLQLCVADDDPELFPVLGPQVSVAY